MYTAVVAISCICSISIVTKQVLTEVVVLIVVSTGSNIGWSHTSVYNGSYVVNLVVLCHRIERKKGKW